jgi:hypothetical protein
MKKEYILTHQVYAPPNSFFYYVKEKKRFWKFTWWKTIASFWKYEDAEQFYKKLIEQS